MRAVSEGEVLVRRPVDAKLVALREHPLVEIGRRIERQHFVASPERSPPSSTSRVTVRFMFLIGVTQRSISSTALGRIWRSSRSRCRCRVREQLLHSARGDVAGRLVAAEEQ